MQKMKIDNLNGKALVWAVCEALGLSPVIKNGGITYRSDHGSWVSPRYLDDSEVGELMSSEWVGVERPSKGQSTPVWRAVTDNKSKRNPSVFRPVVDAFGETLGISVCRVIVKSYKGDVIDIPNELIEENPQK